MHSRSNSFASVFMKRDQNACLVYIFIKFKYGSCGVKNKAISSFFKTLCVVHLEVTVLLQSSRKAIKMFVLIISWSSVKLEYVVWIKKNKSRSLGRISSKSSVHCTCHSLDLVFIKLHQNCLFGLFLAQNQI